MNSTVAKLWVDALKSGKYKKGKNKLNNSNKTFCCLGVLCELAIANGIELEKIVNDDIKSIKYDDSTIYLPLKVIGWAGMRSKSGIIDKSQSLVLLNDMNGTFNEVIEAIEANVEKL